MLSEVPGAFVLALNMAGQARWVRTLEGRSAVRIDGLQVLPDGAVVFSGYFDGFVRSGRWRLDSAGSMDCLLGRLEPGGELSWLVSVGGPGVDQCRRLGVQGQQAWVTGTYSGQWAALALPEAVGGTDAFVMRFDPRTGQPQAGMRFGTAGDDTGRDVLVTDQDQVLVVGSFGGPFDAEGNLVHPPESLVMELGGGLRLSPTSDHDAFVFALSSNGTPRWAIPVATDGFDVVKRIIAGPDGGFLIGGSIQPDAVPEQRPGLAEGSPPLQGFVTALAADGTVAWTWSAPGVVSVTDLVRLPTGVFAVGHFTGELQLGERRWAAASGSTGVFVAQLDEAGVASQGWVCDGPAMDYGWGLAADPDGELFFAGETGWPSTCAPQGSGRLGFVARSGPTG